MNRIIILIDRKGNEKERRHGSKILLSEIKLDSKLSNDLFAERNLEQ
jgi:hypothetical protein